MAFLMISGFWQRCTSQSPKFKPPPLEGPHFFLHLGGNWTRGQSNMCRDKSIDFVIWFLHLSATVCGVLSGNVVCSLKPSIDKSECDLCIHFFILNTLFTVLSPRTRGSTNADKPPITHPDQGPAFYTVWIPQTMFFSSQFFFIKV